MKKLWSILLVIFLSPQIVKAQISFDPGEGCLNVVDFLVASLTDGCECFLLFFSVWTFIPSCSNCLR